VPRRPIVFLDMDGTTVDYMSAALRVHGLDAKTHAFSPDCYWQHEALGITLDEWADPIRAQGADWWANLEPYPHFHELHQHLRTHSGAVYFLSRAVCDVAAAGKARWLRKHAPDTPYFVGNAPKALLAATDTLLIDDSPDECRSFSRCGGGAVLFPQPWNRGHPDYMGCINGALEALLCKS
jgi:hypothetical protein